MTVQRQLPFGSTRQRVQPFRAGLLKWVGNKQRLAHQIASFFPTSIGMYREPFAGSAAVLATLAPQRGVASDAFAPLIDIWRTLETDPELLKLWYAERWLFARDGEKVTQYEKIKSAYNACSNGADLLFLCRSCYGGVVRFRQRDGYMSTPCGAHEPIHPRSFGRRVDEWKKRTVGTRFLLMDYQEAMAQANPGDLVYCDPPYSSSQSILYGAQRFQIADLYRCIEDCKSRGVYVALSIDGMKKSGRETIKLAIPAGLFEQEVFINCGRSMLRRFQMNGKTLEDEGVSDRLLLTYRI